MDVFIRIKYKRQQPARYLLEFLYAFALIQNHEHPYDIQKVGRDLSYGAICVGRDG